MKLYGADETGNVSKLQYVLDRCAQRNVEVGVVRGAMLCACTRSLVGHAGATFNADCSFRRRYEKVYRSVVAQVRPEMDTDEVRQQLHRRDILS
jgi:hypothetical protein